MPLRLTSARLDSVVFIAMKMTRLLRVIPALAVTLLLAGCIPTFIYAHITTDSRNEIYALPPPNAEPWLSINAGIDLYAWQDCYPFLRGEEMCRGLTLTAVQKGHKPDWMRLPPLYDRSSESITVVDDRRNEVVRPLSAHAGTEDRLLGIFRRYEGALAADGDVVLVRPSSDDRDGVRAVGAVPLASRAINIWYDWVKGGAKVNEIRLVIYDARRVWIFSDTTNTRGDTNLFVPSRLFKFDGDAGELASQAMMLYYDDGDPRGHAGRVVFSEQDAANGHRIALAHMPLPLDRLTLDTVTFRRPVMLKQWPTHLCHYSETEFHISMMNDSQRRLPELKGCKPYQGNAGHS